MGRRKITQEAEEQAQKQEQTAESTGSEDGNEREQLTQRMPIDLVDDVDEFAESHGMSRNAAINFLVRESLRDR